METVVSDIWDEIKRYINVVDRDEAAELVVSILIDNDCDVADIRDAFGSDRNIKNALANYKDSPDNEIQDDDEDEWLESLDDED